MENSSDKSLFVFRFSLFVLQPPGPLPGLNIPAGSNWCFTAFISARPSPIGPHTSTCALSSGEPFTRTALPRPICRASRSPSMTRFCSCTSSVIRSRNTPAPGPSGRDVAALARQPLDHAQRFCKLRRQHTHLHKRTAIVLCEAPVTSANTPLPPIPKALCAWQPLSAINFEAVSDCWTTDASIDSNLMSRRSGWVANSRAVGVRWLAASFNASVPRSDGLDGSTTSVRDAAGQRIQLERGRHDDAEASERARQQARQIVARDVLDDDAAPLREPPVGSRELDADNQVARRPVSMAPRSAVVGCHEAADRRAICERRIERNPLAVLRERAIDVAQRRARLDGGRQIAVAMGDNRIQPPGRNQDIDLPRRRPPSEFGTGTAHQHAQLLARRPLEHGADSLAGGRLDDDARNDAFHGIRRRAEANRVDSQQRDGRVGNERVRHSTSRPRQTARSCSCSKSPCRRASRNSRRSSPFPLPCTRIHSAA